MAMIPAETLAMTEAEHNARLTAVKARLTAALDENKRLRAIIETAAEAIERGSTSAPVAEILRGALRAQQPDLITQRLRAEDS